MKGRKGIVTLQVDPDLLEKYIKIVEGKHNQKRGVVSPILFTKAIEKVVNNGKLEQEILEEIMKG